MGIWAPIREMVLEMPHLKIIVSFRASLIIASKKML